ncbi:hypothetical protein GCM10017687_04570 [Streptomyces echinatus]
MSSSRPDSSSPTTRDTVFDLASVSKLFTSVLAVQQIERGTLDLTGTVASYLPEFGRAGKQKVTVRQLLTHTSGFRAWLPLYAAPTREQRLELIWNEAPLHPPGTAYLYSDLNLITLQLVLEKITGRTLDALLRDEITGPLGLDSTRYNPPASWKPRIAATEDARRPWSGLDRGLVWGEVHDENAYGMGGVAGHAGVFSCAWDLAVLGRALLDGGAYGRARILRPESVDLMFTDFNTAFPGDEHGLGLELYQHWYMGAMATPRTARPHRLHRHLARARSHDRLLPGRPRQLRAPGAHLAVRLGSPGRRGQPPRPRGAGPAGAGPQGLVRGHGERHGRHADPPGAGHLLRHGGPSVRPVVGHRAPVGHGGAGVLDGRRHHLASGPLHHHP